MASNDIESGIVRLLEEGPLTITEIQKKMGCARATISKYVAILDAKGIVKWRYVGKAKLVDMVKNNERKIC